MGAKIRKPPKDGQESGRAKTPERAATPSKPFGKRARGKSGLSVLPPPPPNCVTGRKPLKFPFTIVGEMDAGLFLRTLPIGVSEYLLIVNRNATFSVVERTATGERDKKLSYEWAAKTDPALVVQQLEPPNRQAHVTDLVRAAHVMESSNISSTSAGGATSPLSPARSPSASFTKRSLTITLPVGAKATVERPKYAQLLLVVDRETQPHEESPGHRRKSSGSPRSPSPREKTEKPPNKNSSRVQSRRRIETRLIIWRFTVGSKKLLNPPQLIADCGLPLEHELYTRSATPVLSSALPYGGGNSVICGFKHSSELLIFHVVEQNPVEQPPLSNKELVRKRNKAGSVSAASTGVPSTGVDSDAERWKLVLNSIFYGHQYRDVYGLFRFRGHRLLFSAAGTSGADVELRRWARGRTAVAAQTGYRSMSMSPGATALEGAGTPPASETPRRAPSKDSSAVTSSTTTSHTSKFSPFLRSRSKTVAPAVVPDEEGSPDLDLSTFLLRGKEVVDSQKPKTMYAVSRYRCGRPADLFGDHLSAEALQERRQKSKEEFLMRQKDFGWIYQRAPEFDPRNFKRLKEGEEIREWVLGNIEERQERERQQQDRAERGQERAALASRSSPVYSTRAGDAALFGYDEAVALLDDEDHLTSPRTEFELLRPGTAQFEPSRPGTAPLFEFSDPEGRPPSPFEVRPATSFASSEAVRPKTTSALEVERAPPRSFSPEKRIKPKRQSSKLRAGQESKARWQDLKPVLVCVAFSVPMAEVPKNGGSTSRGVAAASSAVSLSQMDVPPVVADFGPTTGLTVLTPGKEADIDVIPFTDVPTKDILFICFSDDTISSFDAASGRTLAADRTVRTEQTVAMAVSAKQNQLVVAGGGRNGGFDILDIWGGILLQRLHVVVEGDIRDMAVLDDERVCCLVSFRNTVRLCFFS